MGDAKRRGFEKRHQEGIAKRLGREKQQQERQMEIERSHKVSGRSKSIMAMAAIMGMATTAIMPDIPNRTKGKKS